MCGLRTPRMCVRCKAQMHCSRTAAVYYDDNEVKVKLDFSSAYSGNLELYAVDWDTHGRRETITVGGQTANLTSDFSEGAWVTIPINQAANSTLTITVDHTAGANAVLFRNLPRWGRHPAPAPAQGSMWSVPMVGMVMTWRRERWQ